MVNLHEKRYSKLDLKVSGSEKDGSTKTNKISRK
jgi:hypothetical protein